MQNVNGIPGARDRVTRGVRWLVDRLGSRLSPQGLEMFYRLCVTQESVAAICGATGLKVASVYQWRRRVTSAVQATLASNSANG